MSNTTVPSISSSTSTTEPPSTLEKLLTTEIILIASIILILLLLAIIICLIWKFVKMNNDLYKSKNKQKSLEMNTKRNLKNEQKYARIALKTVPSDSCQNTQSYDSHKSQKSVSNHSIQSIPSQKPYIPSNASHSDHHQQQQHQMYSPKVVNIVVTPKKRKAMTFENNEEFVLNPLKSSNEAPQRIVINNDDEIVNIKKSSHITPIDDNIDSFDRLQVVNDRNSEQEARRLSAQTNVLSEGHRRASLPDIDDVLMDIQPIQEDQQSMTSNKTNDSNTTKSTIRYKLPQNKVTKAHWM